MKVLFYSAKDFNEGENINKYVEELKKEDFNVTQELYSPGGSTPYTVNNVEVNSVEEIFKISKVIKHSLMLSTSLEDDRPFIEVNDDVRR